ELCDPRLRRRLLVFGVQLALAALTLFLPLGLTPLATLGEKSHGRRKAGMIAGAPSFVWPGFLAPVERQLQLRVSPQVRVSCRMQVRRICKATVGARRLRLFVRPFLQP